MKRLILFAFVACFVVSGVWAEGTQEEAASAEEIKEITWYFKEGSAQVNDEWYAVQKIQEDLGIHFVHIAPGGSDYLTRLQTMLAARNAPEIITSYPELSTNLIKWGVVAPVNKYVLEQPQTYIPNVVRVSNNWELGVQEMTTAEGNIYGVPCTNNSSRTTTQWIRMDWLENVGLEVPTTLDEFVEVMRAFTHEDPDGNGKDDTYGTMMNEFWGAQEYAIPFAASRNQWYLDGAGGVIMGQFHPRHKEYLAFLRDLVAEGLVSEEIPTLKFNVVKERLQAGDFGYGWGWFGSGDEELMRQINPDAVFEPMAPWVGPAYDEGYNGAGGVIREQYLISYQENESDYEAIFELFEWFAEDTSTDPTNPTYEGTYWIASYGEPGVWWDVRDDGLIDVGQWDTPKSQAISERKQGIASWAMKRIRSKFDMAWLLAQPPRFAEQFVFLNSLPTIYDIPEMDPNRIIRGNAVALPTELNEQLSEFTGEQQIAWERLFYSVVLGNEDLDPSWNRFIEGAEDAGLREIMGAVSAEYRKAGLF